MGFFPRRAAPSWCRATASALVLALASTAGCRVAGPPRAEPPTTAPVDLPAAEPTLRVGIAVDAPSVVIRAEGGAEITGPGGRALASAAPDERWTFSAGSGGGIEGLGDQGGRASSAEGPVFIRPDDGGTIQVDDGAYRGEVMVFASRGDGVSAANVVDVEEYLLGVVPAEMPSLEPEAVKAQAVAARTYAVRNMGRHASRGFDLSATVGDQVYGGIGVEDPVATQAVQDTRGEILTYRGAPIMAYYHSTCGGQTAAIDEVWNARPVPYLVSVSDQIPGTDRYYCEMSNRFRWTEQWSGPELARILGEALSQQMGANFNGRTPRIRDIQLQGHTPSGRAAAMNVTADDARFHIRGDSIRWFLRPEPDRILNSTLFTIDASREGGEITELVAHGGGWGHGVGMCQMGAIGRAGAGQGYREILVAYYVGAAVTRLY